MKEYSIVLSHQMADGSDNRLEVEFEGRVPTIGELLSPDKGMSKALEVENVVKLGEDWCAVTLKPVWLGNGAAFGVVHWNAAFLDKGIKYFLVNK